MNIVDIHTHDPARWSQAIVSCTPDIFDDLSAQYPAALFSVGIHPWYTSDTTMDDFSKLERIIGQPRVVAIGETGLDLLRGAPVDVQERIFIRHVELSERVGKPLIIHCVKGWDRLLAIRAAMNPGQNWAIHGFRGKPQLARQLVDKGLWLSVGEHYNPAILDTVPRERLLVESDDSSTVPCIPGFDASAAVISFLGIPTDK